MRTLYFMMAAFLTLMIGCAVGNVTFTRSVVRDGDGKIIQTVETESVFQPQGSGWYTLNSKFHESQADGQEEVWPPTDSTPPGTTKAVSGPTFTEKKNAKKKPGRF